MYTDEDRWPSAVPVREQQRIMRDLEASKKRAFQDNDEARIIYNNNLRVEHE